MKFYGINGSDLNIMGSVTVDIHCDEITEIGANIYVVANDTMSASVIIGRDILKNAKVNLVSAGKNVEKEIETEILNIDTCEVVDGVDKSLIINPEICHAKQLALRDLYVKEYVERPAESKVNAELELRINNVQNFHFSPRRLSHLQKEQLRKILDNLLEKEIIRTSNSEYVSPMVLVQKKTGECRMCIDYRTLNKYILRDNYPIPVIEDQLNVLKNKKYFSVLDLKDRFYHIRMAKDSIKFTAFVTPLGQFEFLKMLFGLKSASTRFQIRKRNNGQANSLWRCFGLSR